MKTLITGGKGLVGSEFNFGLRVGSLNADLTNINKTRYLFSKLRPEYVIHCAAKVGGIGRNIEQVADLYKDNIKINTNVVQVSHEFGVKKFVGFLSTCIFPDKADYPLIEDQIHNGQPHESNFGYAYAKRMLDVQCRAYNKQYGTKYFNIIPTNIYGKNDNYDLDNGHVIPSLIHKCYLAKKQKTDFVVWGSGKPVREFIYAGDVAKITKHLLENYNETEPIIVSNSEQVSIAELAILIADMMGFEGNVIFDKSKPDGQLMKPTDTSKLKKHMPDFKFTPLEFGLKQTIDYFVKNYKSVRK